MTVSASQRQLPGLADQIPAEGVVALLLHQPESGGLIDAPRGGEHIVGPQAKRPVALLARERDASIDELAADTEPAGARLHIEEAQLGDRCRLPDREDRAHDRSVALRHPGMLGLGIELLDEASQYFRNQAFVGHVPAVLLGIEETLAMDDPADIAHAQCTKREGGLRRLRFQQAPHGLHGADQLADLAGRERRDHGRDLLSRGPIETLEYPPPRPGEPERPLPAILRVTAASQVALALQLPEQTAQIASIERQLARDFRRR